uniref:Retrovirus-related Pol polyprotein from transposon TNT 1-94 n=1 Tax=Cajanus cajan TaxID=3821 RepID=A0A151SGK3_CAJCA|nr:Retrovirus-related Pol polyprotein from transposon TNT 1-94 [Cajanus cajan]
MTDCNPGRNPSVPGANWAKDEDGSRVDAMKFRQVVGCLMYLTVTCPDLMFGVSLISRFMADPKESHWAATKRLLRYVKGTTEHKIFYKIEGRSTSLIAYTDNNYAGDLDDRRITSGLVLVMGSGVVSWASKKQPIVSSSTTEAGYITAASCAFQCIWIRGILDQLGAKEKEAIGTMILCDNNSTIQLSKNPAFMAEANILQ